MIHGKTVLAVIPARGGSKGVPRKNIREIGGKPLIAWTIEEAKKSRYIDRLILSSEDKEIIKVAQEWGCDVPFVRPIEIAKDDTPGIEPVLHAVNEIVGFDYVVLLQPTSPLRTFEDIDQCLEICINSGAPACVSVTLVEKSPFWMYFLSQENKLLPIIPSALHARRQELPPVFSLNGAIYVSNIPWLLVSKCFITPETVGYIMQKEHSLDIDEEADFKVFEFMKQ